MDSITEAIIENDGALHGASTAEARGIAYASAYHCSLAFQFADFPSNTAAFFRGENDALLRMVTA